MKNGISAEEKLLKLIRKGKKHEPAAQAEHKPVKARITHKIKHSSLSLVRKHLSFESGRRFASMVFVISCIYLIVAFVYPFFGLKRIKLVKSAQYDLSDLTLEAKESARPYDFYAQGAGGRQIFSGNTTSEAQMAPAIVNADLTKDIILVGVIADKNPQVILEDKKTQKTYYLTKGQYLGQLQIEDIQQGKVTLSSNGQRFELFL